MNIIEAKDIYTDVMKVLDLLCQGKTLTAACAEVGLPVIAFNRAVKKEPQLAELYAEASQIGYDNMADVLLDLTQMTTRYNVSDDKEFKVMSDNIKWYLSKRDQKRFGDKVTVENVITADRAIVDALARGRERALSRIQKDNAEDAAFQVVPSARDVPDDDTENFAAFV